LTIVSSLRSLIGSAAPFAFGFVRLTPGFRRAVIRCVTLGPLVNLAAGAVLDILHLHEITTMEGGVFRLAGAGLPAFLGGFALIAIYAGLLETVRQPPAPGNIFEPPLLVVNFAILLLTGARTPLALATLLILGVLLLQRRLMALAAAGAMLAFGALFLGEFRFIRIFDLLQHGQAGNLSNRNLIWPYFETAIAASPWLGWGVGAGKVVVPTSHGIAELIGTNAAHNEYLRIGCEGGLFGLALLILCMGLWAYRRAKRLPGAERWLLWVVMLAFAVHSATDNTLIATTSSVMFIWMAAVFAERMDDAFPP
jgi:O-antigen ligase